MSPAHPKPVRTNKRGHPWACSCASCRGSRNRRKGLARQRKTAKEFGVAPRYRGQYADEERWELPDLHIEHKSGAQCPKRFRNDHAQASSARAIGDTRPAVVVYDYDDGTKLVVMESSTFLAMRQSGPANAFRIRELLRAASKLLDEARGLAK